MAAHWEVLLQDLVASPEQRVSRLRLLTDADQNQLLAWNNTEAEYPREQCIHQLIEPITIYICLSHYEILSQS